MLGEPGHIYWAAGWIWFLSVDTGEKTGPGLCQVSKSSLFLCSALHIEVRHDPVLECLVETGPCSHLPLHSSAGFERGKESICSSHWGQQAWTCFLGRGCPGPLPERATILTDFYKKIISFCLIPSFNVEGLHFATCTGQHLPSRNAAWGLTLYQNSCRGCFQNTK